MNPSLTIVLPVRNAEARLAAQIDELLDVLPELTGRFEVLVVDDGSSDETADLADQLARRYPQVRVARHAVPLGLAETIQTGLDHTEGELVLVGDEKLGLPADDLCKLWELRHEGDAPSSIRRSDRHAADRRPIHRLLAWTPAQRGGSRPAAEVRLIRRTSIGELRVDRAPTDGPKAVEPARPNFLSKIKAFALGE